MVALGGGLGILEGFVVFSLLRSRSSGCANPSVDFELQQLWLGFEFMKQEWNGQVWPGKVIRIFGSKNFKQRS